MQAPLALRRRRSSSGGSTAASSSIKQYGAFFSDTFQYPAGPKDIVGSCYLIRHGTRYMLWDTGLTDALIGNDFDNPAQTIRVKRSLVDQLAELKLKPEQIETIGISHWHFDHTGQAAPLPAGEAADGQGRSRAASRRPRRSTTDSAKGLAHWLTGGGKVEALTADKDVFGDGRVVMLKLPGPHARPLRPARPARLGAGPALRRPISFHRAGEESRSPALQPRPRRHARLVGPVRPDRRQPQGQGDHPARAGRHRQAARFPEGRRK